MEEIKLNEKEIQDVKKYIGSTNSFILSLGTLRKQFVKIETELLEKIDKLENDYYIYLKFIFQNKSSENMENYIFDSENFVFKKVE